MSMPMPLEVSWEQIALRLLLASLASLLIGLNRDEQGHPAGMRTTMLVCLAATLAMVQVNLLLPQVGKAANSFNVMDLMRLPLGILTGVGFIGAGVIVKREGELVSGVTTAATLWYVTMLGLLFGGGQMYTGIAGTVLAVLILWALKHMEHLLPRDRHGVLQLGLSAEGPREDMLCNDLRKAGFRIEGWRVHYEAGAAPVSLACELRWRTRSSHPHATPRAIEALRELPGVLSLRWKQ